jgi:hypothetical protein
MTGSTSNEVAGPSREREDGGGVELELLIKATEYLFENEAKQII